MRRMLLSMNHPCSSCDGSRRPVHENREALRGLEAQEDGIGRNDRHAEGEIHLQHPERLGVFLPLMLLGIPRLKHAAPAPRQVEMSPDGPVDFEYFRQRLHGLITDLPCGQIENADIRLVQRIGIGVGQLRLLPHAIDGRRLSESGSRGRNRIDLLLARLEGGQNDGLSVRCGRRLLPHLARLAVPQRDLALEGQRDADRVVFPMPVDIHQHDIRALVVTPNLTEHEREILPCGAPHLDDRTDRLFHGLDNRSLLVIDLHAAGRHQGRLLRRLNVHVLRRLAHEDHTASLFLELFERVERRAAHRFHIAYQHGAIRSLSHAEDRIALRIAADVAQTAHHFLVAVIEVDPLAGKPMEQVGILILHLGDLGRSGRQPLNERTHT